MAPAGGGGTSGVLSSGARGLEGEGEEPPLLGLPLPRRTLSSPKAIAASWPGLPRCPQQLCLSFPLAHWF